MHNFGIITLQYCLPSNETRDHVEVCPEGGVVVEELAERISHFGGMALIADYGHNGDKTDTFRVRVSSYVGVIVLSTLTMFHLM